MQPQENERDPLSGGFFLVLRKEVPMAQELEIVTMYGDYLIDSRVLAVRLGYEHKVLLQSIRRHKARLEAKSVVLQCEAKPPRCST